MGITYSKINNTYSVNVGGKQFKYSVKQYGPLAIKLAKQSLLLRHKIFNYIEEKDNCAILQVYNKKANRIFYCSIDIEDIDNIKQYKWYINFPQNAKTFYVANSKVGKLHRFIMNVNNKNIQIDHIDNNGLNNCKSNLRICNQSINSKNITVRSNNKIGINGVHLEKPSNGRSARYVAVWTDNDGKFHKKSFSISKYENALKLAISYRRKMEKLYGYNSK